jgi:alpha-D-ribose 1-methylphosphonate 5-triphosphate synthase subunit PhnH
MIEAAAVPGSAFADPVGQTQAAFRALLTALSEPGRVLVLPAPPPAGLPVGPAALAILLTLADADTPLWLDAAATSAGPYLRFHTGAVLVREPGAARFALVADCSSCPPLRAFALGSDDYPDRSATLVLEVEGLAEDGPLRLAGPGVPGSRGLSVTGLPAGFVAAWADLRTLFPRGLDVLLACGDRVAGLPRTVCLEEPCTSR